MFSVCFEKFPAEVHGIRRAKSDSRGHPPEYWMDVARMHDKRYEAPSIDEGFSEIINKKWEET